MAGGTTHMGIAGTCTTAFRRSSPVGAALTTPMAGPTPRRPLIRTTARRPIRPPRTARPTAAAAGLATEIDIARAISPGLSLPVVCVARLHLLRDEVPEHKEDPMLCREIMKPGVECLSPSSSAQVAAQKMRDLNVGFLPVC